MKIIVGTRASTLAITQTNWVIDNLKQIYPNIIFEVKTITTKGDLILNKPIQKIGGKDIFIKEIENALSNHQIDLAIHSMKDMPSDILDNLQISYTPLRQDPRDCLILNPKYNSIDDLPIGAKIGTGSKRRKFQLLKLRPDLNILPIRGNIDSRIQKIQTDNLDGVVLATAGINRVSLQSKISQIFTIDQMIPSPTQGILCLQIRKADSHINNLLKAIYHPQSHTQAIVERYFLKCMGGSCNVPLGCYCDIDKDDMLVKAFFGDDLGRILVYKTIKGKIVNYKSLIHKLSLDLKQEFIKNGGVSIE